MGTPLISRHLTIAAALGCTLLLTQCVPALDESDGDDDSSLLSGLFAAPEALPESPAGVATAGAQPDADPLTRDPLTRVRPQAAPEWNELAPAALVEACETPGQGEVLTWTDGAAWSLPLLHTDVDTVISGMVADITIVQAFANPFEVPIEAVYLFPLPDDAAVDGMTMPSSQRMGVCRRSAWKPSQRESPWGWQHVPRPRKRQHPICSGSSGRSPGHTHAPEP